MFLILLVQTIVHKDTSARAPARWLTEQVRARGLCYAKEKRAKGGGSSGGGGRAMSHWTGARARGLATQRKKPRESQSGAAREGVVADMRNRYFQINGTYLMLSFIQS